MADESAPRDPARREVGPARDDDGAAGEARPSEDAPARSPTPPSSAREAERTARISMGPRAAPNPDVASLGRPTAAGEPSLEPHLAAIREHFGEIDELELQKIVRFGTERAFVLLSARERAATVAPLLLALDARAASPGTSSIAWSRDKPLAGTFPGATELALAGAPDDGVTLAWFDPTTRSIALRKWRADGVVEADFVLGQVDGCDAISALFWPTHGWLVVASDVGRARAFLLALTGTLAWPREGADVLARPPLARARRDRARVGRRAARGRRRHRRGAAPARRPSTSSRSASTRPARRHGTRRPTSAPRRRTPSASSPFRTRAVSASRSRRGAACSSTPRAPSARRADTVPSLAAALGPRQRARAFLFGEVSNMDEARRKGSVSRGIFGAGALVLGAVGALGAACGGDDAAAQATTSGEAGAPSLTTASSSSSSASSSATWSTGGAPAPRGGGAGGASAGGAGGSGGAGGVGDVDKSQACITDENDFDGDAETPPFGRLDGTLFAVVKPTDVQCALPNDDHVTLEIRALGKVYRAVVNVQSDQGPPDVYFMTKQAPMPAPAWTEGWNADAPLDYASDLGVHSTDFTTYDLTTLSNILTADVELDMPISVYTVTDGGYSSHDVHKNDGDHTDGDIVVDPTSATPTFLLFHFDEQVF